MNIKEAKEQIKNAVTAYLTKDALGRYAIEMSKQRPIFLMGPPGIGKTAIMQQIAEEMDIALISYSMTHHTRQSALGLPRIRQVTYQGREYTISEYTMSEIIASVYETMERTGKKNGILFLDEINCVSETLTPIMLQFLQFKTFGMHSVPEGWVVVTAGNPPEYNNAVHEFDIVTWDRLKRMDVEPDFEVWKEYAYAAGVHAAVLTYLESKQKQFYKIKTTVDGKAFVTARGWEDLSRMIQLYETNAIAVNDQLIIQYLQEPKIAKEFALYYDLWNQYRSDYQISDILDGRAGEDIRKRAAAAKFDERFSLLGLLLEVIMAQMQHCVEEHQLLTALMETLRPMKSQLRADHIAATMETAIREQEEALEKGRIARSMSDAQQGQILRLLEILEQEKAFLLLHDGKKAPFQLLKQDFNERVKAHSDRTAQVNERLSNLFRFCDEVFPNGQELLILVAELAANPHSARFLSKYENPEYFRHDREMLFHQRHQELLQEIDRLDFFSFA